jgi:ABC-type glycerol-3-phosphate transport system substrate-binding protein
MKNFNKILAAVLASAVLLLTACGEIPEPPQSTGPVPKFSYEREVLDFDLTDIHMTGCFTKAEDCFILLAARGDWADQTLARLYIYDDNTAKIEDFPEDDYFPPVEDRSYKGLFPTDSGYTAVFTGSSSPVNLIFEFYDKDFTLINRVKSDFAFDSFQNFVGDGKQFYLLGKKQGKSFIRSFGENGDIAKEIDVPQGAFVMDIALSAEGELVYAYTLPGSLRNTVESKGETPFTITSLRDVNLLLPGGMGYAAFGVDSQYVYGYKTDGSLDTIMPITDLEQQPFTYLQFSQGGDVKTCFSDDYGKGQLVRNTYSLYIPEPDNRQVLTLSTDYEIQIITYAVAAFNRENTEYKVEIVELGDRENPEINGFDKALISGTLGDILIPPEEGNENYIEKGIYADLYPFIDNDPDFSRDLFIPQVLKALETDGKLLRLWNTFSVETYYVPEGGLPPTYANLRKLIEENPDSYILPIIPRSRENFLSVLLKYNASYFVESGELNGDEIRDLLWICKNAKFPQGVDEYGDLDIWEFYDRFENNIGYYKDVKTFFIDSLVSARETQTVGAARCVPVGMPTPSGETKHYIIGRDVAINNTSPNKEAAWEFLKFYAEFDEHKGKVFPHTSYFPITKERFEIEAAYMLERYDKMREENGDDYVNTYQNNGVQYTYNLPAQSDYDELLSLLDNAVSPQRYDIGLFNIIAEEAAPYLDGKKTLEEALALIKNRADIYIAEHQ